MWYVLYTKPAKEDAVTFRLKDIGIEVLNPRLSLTKFKRNRLVKTIEPLFPCYLFANFEKDRYSHLITYTRGVRYIVGKDNPITVNDEIIRSIMERMKADGIVALEPQGFQRGERVYIRDGPFRRFYGIFEREIKGSERSMILLETLNYRVELERGLLSKPD